MLKFRIIGRINIRNNMVIKTIRCEGVRKVGSPTEIASRIAREGIDEIVVVDCVASLYGRNTLHGVISDMADDVFCPITVCGGVGSIADVQKLLSCGADKVGVNTAAVADPTLLERLAMKFGSSTIVSQIDVKRNRDGDLVIMTNGARQGYGIPVSEWAEVVSKRGSGEIFMTSVDREGTTEGIDTKMMECFSGVSVPVVVSGGINTLRDVRWACQYGASGVAMSKFNYGADVGEFKRMLGGFIPLRME